MRIFSGISEFSEVLISFDNKHFKLKFISLNDRKTGDVVGRKGPLIIPPFTANSAVLYGFVGYLFIFLLS